MALYNESTTSVHAMSMMQLMGGLLPVRMKHGLAADPTARPSKRPSEKPVRRPSKKPNLEVNTGKKLAVNTEKQATGQAIHGHRPAVKTEQNAKVTTKMKIAVKTHPHSDYSLGDTVAEPLPPKQEPLLEQQIEQQTTPREKRVNISLLAEQIRLRDASDALSCAPWHRKSVAPSRTPKLEKLEPQKTITFELPGDVEADSDAAVDSESEDSSQETESADDCADSYVALPVNPTATGPGNAIVEEVDDASSVGSAGSELSSNSTSAFSPQQQQRCPVLEAGPPEFLGDIGRKCCKTYSPTASHELLVLPGVHRRHWIFFARCKYCNFLSEYIQRTAFDFDTKQVAGVPPHRVPSFWG